MKSDILLSLKKEKKVDKENIYSFEKCTFFWAEITQIAHVIKMLDENNRQTIK